MTDDDLEGRLRRHFADRTAKEPAADDGGPGLPLVSRRPRIGRAIGAVAAAAVVLLGALVLLRDDDTRVDATDEPITTTTEPVTTTSTDTTTTTLGVPAASTVIASSSGVLGWWDGSGWVQPQVTDAHPVADGDTFTVLGIGYPPAQGVATNVQSQAEFCTPGLLVDIGGFEDPARPRTQHPPLAVRGVDDPNPRPAVELALDTSSYVDLARTLIAGLGIDDPAAQLVQLVRADLEGDGVDEVLMVVEREDGDLFAEPGDYSVAVLRQVIDGQPVTTILAQSIAVDEPDQTPFVQLSRVIAIADANGDGRMEFALHRRYYEGSGTSLYEAEADGSPREVLKADCGV